MRHGVDSSPVHFVFHILENVILCCKVCLGFGQRADSLRLQGNITVLTING